MEISIDTFEHSEKSLKQDLSSYGEIRFVELSPFELSQDAVLVGFDKKVLLGQLKLVDEIQFDIIAEFVHPSRTTALAFSPETSLHMLPNVVLFASAGSDFLVRIFRSDLKEDNICRELKGHENYINDAKFDPENNYLATVSDDNSTKLWDTEKFQCVGTLHLTSPGMSICWHRDDSSKLLVAEKFGLIRFYNVETRCPILSLDYGRPLSCAHWAPSDPQLVVSLHLGEILIWDIAKPCVPIGSSLMFAENGGYVKISPFAELVSAVNSLEGAIRVIDIRNQRQKLNANVMSPTNICWHYRYPLLCVGDYTTLCFWKVKAK